MIASVVICVIEKVSFTNQKQDLDESHFFKNRDVWKKYIIFSNLSYKNFMSKNHLKFGMIQLSKLDF